VDANAFSAFSLSVVDNYNSPVSLELSNAAISNGANTPSVGQLRDYLRLWLFARNTLTKPSDYRFWFLSQPEVGDCLTWGDTEEFYRTGSLSITGKLKVCLLSKEGTVLSASAKAALNTRVQPVKDVTYLEYPDPTFAYHYFKVRYSGALDSAAFEAEVRAELSSRYNLELLRSRNMSLFDPLEVGAFFYVIVNSTNLPRGVEVVPYYYLGVTVAEGATQIATSFPSPNNLKRGFTRYLYQDLDAQGNVTAEEEFTELLTAADVATIVRANGSSAGTHNYLTNTITVLPSGASFGSGILKVYGEARNRSFLDTGAFNRARALGDDGVEFELVSEVY